jgi:hypothetical protein
MFLKGVRRFCLLSPLFLTVVFADDSPPLLSVIFGDREVALQGTIDSEETATEIANEIKAVRPDLAITNAGLKIEPGAELPNKRHIISILVELGLSTHEGRLEIRDESILVGGLTDSLVTMTALNLRTEPILEGRKLINHVCLVHTDDLPDISVKLASGETAKAVLDFDFHPTAEQVFEAPGLPVEKWFPAVVMLSDFNRLEGKALLTATPVEETIKLIATPAELVMAPTPAESEPRFAKLESIRFSRNTFFLQANQQLVVAETAKRLQEGELADLPVVLEAVKVSGGSGAFNEYTCERRLTEARSILKELGVSEARFLTRIRESDSQIDTGEIRVLVELPIPEPEPASDAESAADVATNEGTVIPSATGTEAP